MKLFKKSKTSRIIYSANIDLNYELRNEGQRLHRNNTIWLPNQEKKIESKEIEKLIEQTIKYDLEKEIKKTIGLDIRTEINSTRYGSIEVIFTVFITTFSFIAGIKGFYDSIMFIKKQSERLLKSNLNEQFGDFFSIGVTAEYPSIESRDISMKELDFLLRKGKYYGHYEPINEKPKRDGFFWYLLISNIILLGIIGLLIIKAVINYYG